MDNLSHTLPKKSYRDNNGFSAAGNTIYDDVFGGPPKFGVSTLPPRLDDYAEIFQAFHASRPSSIPFLDLPVAADDDSDLCFDVRASNFDYSEVFGGFNGLDFAVSYEELVRRSNVGDDSSEDAWTPAQSESLSDESVPSTSSGVNRSLSNADPDQSLETREPLKLSHNSAGSETIKYSSGSDGMSHEDQFNVVPESNFFVDEIHPSQKIENEKLPSQLNHDHCPSMDYGGNAGGKRLGKSISQPLITEFGIERYATGLNPVEGSGKTGSSGNRPLLSVSDISLKTRPSQLPPPSRPPPALASRKGDPPTLDSKVKAAKSYAFEQMADGSSPPYYDVEIDASSSAAASAAAMKDAMEKAQAQLRSAKELMERKRSGLQNRTKLRMEKDIEDKEVRLRESCDRSSIFEDGRIQCACEEEDSGRGLHAWEESHKPENTIQIVTGSVEGQKNKYEAGNSVESKSTMGQMSSEGSQSEGTHASVGATQLTDMVGRKQVKDSKILEQSTTCMDFVLEMEDIESFERQNVDRYTEAREHRGWQENKNQLESTADQNNQNMETEVIPNTSCMDVKHLKKQKVADTASEVKEKEKILRISQQLGEIEKTVIRVDENEILDNLTKNEVENGVKLVASNEKLGTEKTQKSANIKDYKLASAGTSDCEIYGTGLKADVGQEKCGIEVKKTLGQGAREQRHIEAQEKGGDQKKEDKSYDEVESERKVEEPPLWDENEKAFEMPLKDENEMCRDRAKMVFSQEEQIGEETLLHGRPVHEKKAEVLAPEENVKKQTFVGEKKQYAETLNCAWEKEENVETYDQVCNPEGYKRTSQEVQAREESEEREKVVFEKEGVEKKLETLEKESENRVQDAYSLELLRGKNKDLQQLVREGEHKSVNLIKENCVEIEENFKTSYMVYEVDNNEIKEASRVSERDVNTENCEIASEALDGEGDGNIQTDQRDCEKLIESVEWAYDVDEEAVCLAGEDQKNLEHERANMRVKVLKSFHVPGITAESNEGENTWESNEGDNGGDIAGKLYECESIIQQTPAENGKIAFKLTSELGYTDTQVHNHRGKTLNGVHFAVNLDGSNDKVSFPQGVGGCAAVGSNTLPSMFIKRDAHNPAPKVTSRSIGRKDEKPSEILREEREREEKLQQERVLENDRLRKIEEERKREEKLQQERALENDRLRKIDEEREREEKLQQERVLENDRLRKIEEREREREREKDRMAVDRTTLEAREKAFAEARERAERAAVERATAEVRQRALAEARERLEKACAEARERSLAEKTSFESRFRAERPAVEKAAAEARERAVEKAMADKAAFEARDRTERSVADKFSASSRSTGIKPSSTSYDLPDSQFQNAGSYIGSRYSHISSNNVGEGDSPQRCKARLERHHRIAERAAKALAEKNRRDLVAQKEQAERSRLAEGLDAEVKRWSSGKEGNLRALLSTLQYSCRECQTDLTLDAKSVGFVLRLLVCLDGRGKFDLVISFKILGPDCGWQPVPLTEVITTVAVKKAYRKATLCVHPDKLQQRGASIQQKYICEKVFDLLKEAWNKFNSEER